MSIFSTDLLSDFFEEAEHDILAQQVKNFYAYSCLDDKDPVHETNAHIWYNKLPNNIKEVYEQEAEEIRSYYQTKMMLEALDGKMSKYRADLVEYLSCAKENPCRIPENLMGIVCRLPYHYHEDVFLDQLKQRNDIKTKIDNIDDYVSFVRPNMSLSLIGTYQRYTPSRNSEGTPRPKSYRKLQRHYWFKDEHNLECAYRMVINNENPFSRWFYEKTKKTQNVKLKILAMHPSKHPGNFNYLDIFNWDLDIDF